MKKTIVTTVLFVLVLSLAGTFVVEKVQAQ